MDLKKQAFLRDVGKELLEENVAVFAGAGMSAGAGFVNWAELLRPIADELGLDVDKENDLDHETFIFEQYKRKKYDYETQDDYDDLGAFNFCKTNRKPYDALVWNILRKAYQIAPKKISIGNDDGVRFHAL